ncbi:MAG: mandelate racemase/muconate lactonizing enzyme family protein [Deltaproteobacteria bacterium]|jgi:muconate cycloisomerase|nr:mandelate racemase/muconate lactonizing enzyme family protein [Deltaproteobacteria bacterium]
MKIKEINFSPLFMTFKEPYHWYGRIDYGATVILITVVTDQGLVGHGESTSSFPAEGSLGLLGNVVQPLIGQSVFDIDRHVFRSRHLGLINDTIRMPNLLLTGLEMALWDVVGQAAGQPLYRLWGGAARDFVDYFGFVQGDTAEELSDSAKKLVEGGFRVIYLKVGRGEKSDPLNVRAVREAIGPDLKLRLDANESWDVFTAKNMIKRLAEHDIEFVEQPVSCRSLSALREVKESSPIPIAVDQGGYSLEEIFEICAQKAADVLVLSPHETGGALNFKKAAAIGEAAKIPVCLHGQFTTGLTDLFHHHLGLTLPNLTDGNQIMNQLYAEDLLESPGLELSEGRLGLPGGAGIGARLDGDVIARSQENYVKWTGGRKKNVDFIYKYK